MRLCFCSVHLSVCLQNNFKNYLQILMKVIGNIDTGIRNRRLNFSSDLDYFADQGIFERLFLISVESSIGDVGPWHKNELSKCFCS